MHLVPPSHCIMLRLGVNGRKNISLQASPRLRLQQIRFKLNKCNNNSRWWFIHNIDSRIYFISSSSLCGRLFGSSETSTSLLLFRYSNFLLDVWRQSSLYVYRHIQYKDWVPCVSFRLPESDCVSECIKLRLTWINMNSLFRSWVFVTSSSFSVSITNFNVQQQCSQMNAIRMKA